MDFEILPSEESIEAFRGRDLVNPFGFTWEYLEYDSDNSLLLFQVEFFNPQYISSTVFLDSLVVRFKNERLFESIIPNTDLYINSKTMKLSKKIPKMLPDNEAI